MKLIAAEKMLLDNLIKNDDWYDAKLAGYWICSGRVRSWGGLFCMVTGMALQNPGYAAR